MRITHFLAGLSALGLGDARKCNGHEHLCDKKYSNVTFVGSHNANFFGDGISHNQHLSLTHQLDMGIRFLTTQTHWEEGTIRMRHNKCWLLDMGTLDDFLLEIGRWMAKHPNEVVTIIMTNPTSISELRYAKAFRKTGLDKTVFRHRERFAIDQWPTLGQLVDKNQRLVIFMDNTSHFGRVDWINDWFSYSWETPYGELDNNFPHCKRDRPGGHIDESKYMYLVNHIWNEEMGGTWEGKPAKMPTRHTANTTNSMDSVSRQVDLRKAKWGKIPNVILLDFIDAGDAIEVQDYFNS